MVLDQGSLSKWRKHLGLVIGSYTRTLIVVHSYQLFKLFINIASRRRPSSSSDSAEANDKRTY